MQNAFKDRDPQNVAEKVGQYAESAIDQGEKKAKSAMAQAQSKFREGQEQITDLVENIDHKLHENPWPIVAGVAVGCLFLGFLMGSKGRS